MNQKNIVSQHIGSMLCRSDISVTDMLGIQSQFSKYYLRSFQSHFSNLCLTFSVRNESH